MVVPASDTKMIQDYFSKNKATRPLTEEEVKEVYAHFKAGDKNKIKAKLKELQ